VNLVGVFAFHDLHAHGDDDDDGGEHGHSHSHGGHGHSHAHEEKKGGENVYGVYLHIIADTLGSVSVIISSLLIQFFGWTIADPICSFGMSVLIFVSVIPLIKSSATTLLQCTPPTLDEKLQNALKKIGSVDGVVSYAYPHFWKQSKDMIIGTLHVQIKSEANEQKILGEVSNLLKKKGVKNLTVQVMK